MEIDGFADGGEGWQRHIVDDDRDEEPAPTGVGPPQQGRIFVADDGVGHGCVAEDENAVGGGEQCGLLRFVLDHARIRILAP
jgi:hypothetical protein